MKTHGRKYNFQNIWKHADQEQNHALFVIKISCIKILKNTQADAKGEGRIVQKYPKIKPDKELTEEIKEIMGKDRDKTVQITYANP